MDKKRCRCTMFYCLQCEQFGHGVDSTCHHSKGGMKDLEKLVREHESNAVLESGETQLANERLMEFENDEKFIIRVKNLRN